MLRESSRDMMVFAFFLFVSAGFWLLQKLNDTFESVVHVPLELVGIPKSVIITTPLPSTLTVTIRDRGTNLFHYVRSGKLRKPITLDFSLYDNGSLTGIGHIPMSDVQHALQQQLLTSTRIQRISPDTLEFFYNRGLAKRVPVKFQGKIETQDQTYLRYVDFNPDSVTVYAPQAVRDTLRYAYILPQEHKEVGHTTTYDASFMPIRGVLYKPSTVKMTAQVDIYTERTIRVPVVGTNFPAGISLKTFPAEVSVTYRVGAQMADKINAGNFVLAVTYEELLRAKNANKYHLRLKSIPVGVSNVRIMPREVDYLLEKTQAEADLQPVRE